MKFWNYFEDESLRHRAVLATAILFIGIIYPILAIQRAHAATMTQVLVRFDRMAAGRATTGTICAKPATGGSITSYAVVFPNGTTLGTAANWQTANISTTNLAWPSGAIAWLNATTGTAVVTGSGGATPTVTWTITSASFSTSSLYCFNWTNTAALTVTSTTGANQTGTITLGSDTGTYATAVLTAGGPPDGDQITVSATINPTFSFAINVNTDTITGQLTTAIGASASPRTATVNTNAKNGWLVWAKDTNTGLTSASAGSYNIPGKTPGTVATITAGTDENTVLGVTSSQVGGTGTITVATAYAGSSTATTGTGSGLDTTLRTLATSTGTANTAVLTLTNYLAIKSTTPAATDYTDLQTYVAAGLF